MTIKSTIASLLELKPISRELAEFVARKMGMSVDQETGIVTAPQVLNLGEGAEETRLGEHVILCFEFNFLDERRERLREQQFADNFKPKYDVLAAYAVPRSGSFSEAAKHVVFYSTEEKVAVYHGDNYLAESKGGKPFHDLYEHCIGIPPGTDLTLTISPGKCVLGVAK